MHDAIIIIVVLLLLLLLISVFGGSLRYTPSAETFYQSLEEGGEEGYADGEDQAQDQEQEQAQEMPQMSAAAAIPDMNDPQIDTFAELTEDSGEQQRVPSGELSPMMMNETFQQAEKSATEAMRKIINKMPQPEKYTNRKEVVKKVEAFQNGGHFAAF